MMGPFPASAKTGTKRCLELPVNCFMKGPILFPRPLPQLKNKLAEKVISKTATSNREGQKEQAMG